MKNRPWLYFCLACLLTALTGLAQSPTQAISPLAPPPAHVPPGLLSAKTVFISNAGADSQLFPSPFTGTPERAYEKLYAAMQSWNRYQIVNDPAQADIVLELRLIAPAGPQYKKPNVPANISNPLPRFDLIVYDRSTHYILWAFSAAIEDAYMQKSHDRNFDLALTELTNDLKRITQVPAPAP